MFVKMLIVTVTVLSLAIVGRCDNQESRFHDPRNVRNMDHIKEHMGEIYQGDDVDQQLKLDDEEAMEFHYFKLHDYDNNNKLDGLELGAAMTHFHEEHSDDKQKAPGITLSDQDLASLIEQILAEDDLNDDGYVDYYEFIHAQKRNQGGAQDNQQL